MVLGTRGDKSSRKIHFVFPGDDGICVIKDLAGNPLPEEKVKVMIESMCGLESMIHKCHEFPGTMEEFMALPPGKRNICWRDVNRRWVEYLRTTNPEGKAIGFIVDGLHSQALYEQRHGK